MGLEGIGQHVEIGREFDEPCLKVVTRSRLRSECQPPRPVQVCRALAELCVPAAFFFLSWEMGNILVLAI